MAFGVAENARSRVALGAMEAVLVRRRDAADADEVEARRTIPIVASRDNTVGSDSMLVAL